MSLRNFKRHRFCHATFGNNLGTDPRTDGWMVGKVPCSPHNNSFAGLCWDILFVGAVIICRDFVKLPSTAGFPLFSPSSSAAARGSPHSTISRTVCRATHGPSSRSMRWGCFSHLIVGARTRGYGPRFFVPRLNLFILIPHLKIKTVRCTFQSKSRLPPAPARCVTERSDDPPVQAWQMPTFGHPATPRAVFSKDSAPQDHCVLPS